MTESAQIRTLDPMDVPESKDAAERLITNLGYRAVTIYRIESDRILYTTHDRAMTLCLEFDHGKEQVHLRPVEGWPVD